MILCIPFFIIITIAIFIVELLMTAIYLHATLDQCSPLKKRYELDTYSCIKSLYIEIFSPETYEVTLASGGRTPAPYYSGAPPCQTLDPPLTTNEKNCVDIFISYNFIIFLFALLELQLLLLFFTE